MMEEKLVPSLLAADFWHLEEQIQAIEAAGVSMLHLDIMDGCFVPNISMGFPVVETIRSHTNLLFDMHLMVQNPERYIGEAVKAGADIITVHEEACPHLHRTICQIREAGKKAGVALNPATPLNMLEYIIMDLDVVLIMTVNPGFGGQVFLMEMLDKIRECRKLLDKKAKNVQIELDGGITCENVKACLTAGAELFVAGSSVFRGNILENIKAFGKTI